MMYFTSNRDHVTIVPILTIPTHRRCVKLRRSGFAASYLIKSVLGCFVLLLLFSNVHGNDDEEPLPDTDESGFYQTIRAGYYAMKSLSCRAVGRECCVPPFLNTETAVSALNKTLRREFFGQHLALETVLLSLDAHLRDPDPGKALVLSFHGWAGSGKSYLAQHITKALFREGLESKYVKFYMSSYHFPDPDKVTEYQKLIRDQVLETVKKCPLALFVFDEVDKTPPGVFDAVAPFIEVPGRIEGVNHKKAIFIFLSNAGSAVITKITKDAWHAGKRREDLTFRDFQEDLQKGVFNDQHNGLYMSSLIDRVLVDYFIPFLPMEKRHVIQCVEMEARKHRARINAEELADTLAYWPADLKLYSQTGCKRVEGAVKYEIARQRYARNTNNRESTQDDATDETKKLPNNEEL